MPASHPPLRTPVPEQLLIGQVERLAGPRVLCTTLGRGQFAASAARRGANVVCHVFDIYHAEETAASLGEGLPIQTHCAADLPASEFDAVAVPVEQHGEAELTREILQAGHQRLIMGGQLIAATNNPRDRWLAGEMEKLFAKVSRLPAEEGLVYLAAKDAPLKKPKNFQCEFAFRDRERLIKAVSRPGVFSHRSLDGGARSLMNVMQIRAADRVLDLGCGSGTVSLAAAFRAAAGHVLALDSHTRAIASTGRGAEINGLQNVQTRLTADGETGSPGTFDVALANPPYYSGYRIAEIFLKAAHTALRPGGMACFVTKSVDWYADHVPKLFRRMKVHTLKQYQVVEAVR